MISRQGSIRALGTVVLFLTVGATAQAARAQFHYAPADSRGTMTLVPGGSSGAQGEQITWFGIVREPAPCPASPNQMLTFRHPCSGRTVIVPVRLPEGTPRMEYRTNRVIYNYGSYTIEVHFLDDGSVDVLYNSGLMRAL